MIIGVDAFPLNKLNGGIGYYIFYLLEELIQQKPEHIFYLYAGSDQGDIAHLSRYLNVRIKKLTAFRFSHTLWRFFSLTFALILDRVDIFWGTTQSIPLLKRKKMKTFLTLYDFVYLLEPRSMPTLLCLYFKTFMPLMLKKADRIFPISQGTASKLKRFYGIHANQIIYPPIRPELKPLSQSDCAHVLIAKDLCYNEFLLTVGTLEPRKNFIELVQTYLELLKTYPEIHWMPLVIIGGGGWKNREIRSILNQASESYPQHIKLLGYVSDSELVYYLSGARYYISLSQYEGYGMPLAEARACGTPIVCFDSVEMREAAENEGFFLKKENLKEQLTPIFQRSASGKTPIKHKYPANRKKIFPLVKAIEEVVEKSTI